MSQGEKDCEERLTSTISANLHEGAKKAEFLFSSACIYRVSEELRKLNASAYTPRLIAIGPLHRNDNHLQTPMQQVKISYANHLLCRLTEGLEDRELEQNRLSLLQECVAEMKSSIDDAKKCYAEEVTLDVEMMLVDGCFILELLYRNRLRILDRNRLRILDRNRLELLYRNRLILESNSSIGNIDSSHPIVGSDNGDSEETMTASTELQPLPVPESRIEVERSRTSEEILGLQADPIFGNRLTSCAVRLDLLLLENQIPYLVLEKLFQLTVGRIPSGLNRLSLTDYLVPYFRKKMRPEGVPSRPANHQYHHILHKVHDGYLPPDQTGKIINHEIMPSATELVYAGVKFVRGTEEVNLFKVKFNKPEGPFWWCRSARFEIPTLEMDDSTESFIRNVIAFEQCCPGIPQYFTSYAILMDMLVDSDKDVQVLEKAGVVRNLLGASEDATNLFNKLCKEVVEGEFFFADICNRAHNYRRSFWPKNNAHVRRQYFASPWRFIAFCLAFCAVGISITQFFRSFSSPQIN